jgi:hypothetical protein
MSEYSRERTPEMHPANFHLLRASGLPVLTSRGRPCLCTVSTPEVVNPEEEMYPNILKISYHLTGNMLCQHYEYKSKLVL